MDNISGSINPMSDKFQSFAVRNVSQQMGTLRTTKELSADEGEEARQQAPEDSVELSSSGKLADTEYMEAAQRSGVLSEESDRIKKQEKSRKGPERVGVQPGSPEAEEAQVPQGRAGVSEPEAIIHDVSGARKSLTMDEIRGDTPPEMFEAARTIVKGQIHPVTGPSASLRELKSVDEITRGDAANIQTFHPLMAIHDTYNQPIAILE